MCEPSLETTRVRTFVCLFSDGEDIDTTCQHALRIISMSFFPFNGLVRNDCLDRERTISALLRLIRWHIRGGFGLAVVSYPHYRRRPLEINNNIKKLITVHTEGENESKQYPVYT